MNSPFLLFLDNLLMLYAGISIFFNIFNAIIIIITFYALHCQFLDVVSL